MSVIKAFFGLGRIPKVKKYFEFESFDDLNQTGGMIGQIQETVRRGGLQLTPAQKKFLEDQMEQVKLAFDMTKISLKSPSPEKSGKVIQADFGKPFKEEVKKMETDAQIKARLEEGNKKSASALRIEKLRKEISDIDRKIDARVIQLEQRGVKDFETDSLFNKLNDQKNDLEFKKDFEEEIFGPQDMADGGRIGLRMGSRKKTATGDYEGFDLSYLKDLSPEVQKAFLRRLYTGNMTKQADGGRVGYFLGSPPRVQKGQGLLRALLNYFGKETGKARPSDFLRLTNPKSFNKLFEAAQGKMSKEGIMGTDMVKDYQTQMRGERIKSIKDMLESGKNIKRSQDRITSYKNEVKQKFMDDLGLSEEEAEVAATRLSTLAENIVNKEGSRKLPNITEEGILQLENIIKNMETGGKKARELNAYGGRIGYKLGGIDKGRRAFLAALGAGAAGIGAAKTGILKFLGKGKKASKALEVTTPNAPGKPEWFDALVNKVIKEGNDVSKNFATKEREIVHVKALDDETTIYVHRDLDTGTVRVDIDDPFRNVQGEQGDALVSLEVKPGIADETTRGKPADEFVAVENDYANYMDGPDDYVTEVIDNTVTDTKNLTSDLTKVKLYAKDQKKPTIKELMESRKRKKMLDQAENEPSQYAADRQPDYNPDPEEYMDDNFASGGIARMLGE